MIYGEFIGKGINLKMMIIVWMNLTYWIKNLVKEIQKVRQYWMLKYYHKIKIANNDKSDEKMMH